MLSLALRFFFAAATLIALPAAAFPNPPPCQALFKNKSKPANLPAEIDVAGPVNANLFAVGTQNYNCSAGAWTFVNPEAVLFDGRNRVGTHYFLPQKDAQGGQPVWQSDDIRGCGKVVTKKLAQWNGPNAANIPWLRTEATQREGGCPIGSTKYVLRVDTQGGVAPPASECRNEGEIRKVPYTTGYVFIG